MAGENYVLVKINGLDFDVALNLDRLLITGDDTTGKMYKITTQDLVDVIVGQLGTQGVSYKGAADTTTNPGSPTSPEFYTATETGTYTNFLDSSSTAITVAAGEDFVILSFDGTNWTKQVVDIDLSGYLQKNSILSTPFGKNLFNKSAVLENKQIHNNGTLVFNTGFYVSDKIEISQNEDYTISGLNLDILLGKYYRWLDENNTVLSFDFFQTTTQTITAPSTAVYFQFTALNDGDSTSLLDAIQFEEGLEATGFEPYKARVTKIGDNYVPYSEPSGFALKSETYTKTEVDNKIPDVEFETIKTSKNLFDKSKATDNYYLSSNGTPVSNTAYGYSDFIPVISGKQYSGYDGTSGMRKTCYFDGNKNVVSGGSENLIETFTAPAGVSFVRVTFYELRKDTFQFEESSQPTSFEPYSPPEKILISVDGAIIDNIESTESLTIESSDKILFTGCSYEESIYSPKGKSWINRLSNYTDWMCANYGNSGDRLIDIANRLRNNTPKYGIYPKEFNPTFITIANNGNETLPQIGQDLDLYMKQVEIVANLAKQYGAKPIIGTDYHTNNNPFVESQLKGYADENHFPYMGIGRNGNNIMSKDYVDFWNGSHPGVRANNFEWNEWNYFISQLDRPRKSIKVFRPRNTNSSISDLNYDNLNQRVERFQEINVGEMCLNPSDGSDEYYDRLDSGKANYSSIETTNEYSKLINGQSLEFSNLCLIELIFDKVDIPKSTITLNCDSGATIYLKSNNEASKWIADTRDEALVFKVSEAVYNSFSDSVGTKFTSSAVKNDTVQFSFTGKLKSYAMGKSWYLCFNADSPVSFGDRTPGAGSLTRVSDSTTVSYESFLKLMRYDYNFLNKMGIPLNEFVDASALTTYLDGKYQIEINDNKYYQFDKVKVLIEKNGTFNVSNISATYSGGRVKPSYTKEIKQKPFGKEMIDIRGFDSDWLTTGGWINDGATLKQMPLDVRDYPPFLSTTNHIELGFDSDGFPQRIFRDINLSVTGTDRRGWQKCMVRVIARLFPKIYNPSKTGTYYTSTKQITEKSYDMALLCFGMGEITGGRPPLVLRKPVGIGWQEITFETTLPIFNDNLRIYLWRDVVRSTENNSFPMQIYDVSLQVIVA